MVRIFVSYAHEDKKLRAMLRSHLGHLIHDCVIEYWDDREPLAGTEWDPELRQQLDAADVILLLISADFFGSYYCYCLEMPRALQRRETEGTIVIPVILRDCDWHNTPVADFEVLPCKGEAATDWANIDDALANVTRGIREVVESICKKRE